jgi:nicotinamidase-related amidase
MSMHKFPAPWALLINECQRGLLEKDLALFPGIQQQAEARGIVAPLARLAAAFRQQGLPVIHIHVTHRPDFAGVSINNPAVAYIRNIGGLVAGTEQVRAVAALAPEPTDHIVCRHSGMTVFYGNHLDSLLRNLGVNTLIATGVSTNAAIPGMVLGGLDRGFRMIVPEDCIAGASAESHAAILQHLIKPLARVCSSSDLLAELQHG